MRISSLLPILWLSLFTISLPLEARESVSAAEVNGTFTNQVGSTFEILALGKNKLHVSFLGVYVYKPPKGEPMARTGEASGTADIQGDTAVLRPEGVETSCTIRIHFSKPGKIQVSQDGDSPDCGFGANVRADGIYRKTSKVKPKQE